MPLNGELSDLSLSELIEFFCNQRKTGRLEVTYINGSIELYLHSGALVHAQIGMLRGVDAVYYALTQPNASFKFSPQLEGPEQTINQPWSSVVLEGLRRMDEGVPPPPAFPEETAYPTLKVAEPPVATPATIDSPSLVRQEFEKFEAERGIAFVAKSQVKTAEVDPEIAPAPVEPSIKTAEADRETALAPVEPPVKAPEAHKSKEPVVAPTPAQSAAPAEKKADATAVKRSEPSPAVATPKRVPATSPLFAQVEPKRTFGAGRMAAVAIAVVLLIAGVAVPWRWYARSQAVTVSSDAVPPVINPSSSQTAAPGTNDSASIAPDTTNALANSSSIDNESHKVEQRRTESARPKTSIPETPLTSSATQPVADPNQRTVKPQPSPAAGGKKVTVQVTYDENGRVTQATGGDATALRIARQKRFPAGKPGSATVTIPIN